VELERDEDQLNSLHLAQVEDFETGIMWRLLCADWRREEDTWKDQLAQAPPPDGRKFSDDFMRGAIHQLQRNQSKVRDWKEAISHGNAERRASTADRG
jgi:hypothetical protein